MFKSRSSLFQNLPSANNLLGIFHLKCKICTTCTICSYLTAPPARSLCIIMSPGGRSASTLCIAWNKDAEFPPDLRMRPSRSKGGRGIVRGGCCNGSLDPGPSAWAPSSSRGSWVDDGWLPSSSSLELSNPEMKQSEFSKKKHNMNNMHYMHTMQRIDNRQ